MKILLDNKITISPTNINGVYKYNICFYLRITFPNPHILLKAMTLCVCFKICQTLLFSASGSKHDNINNHKNICND